ncbi:MAG: NAD-binding protein, partial [Candidatus Diapherotrites archaeon]|nr:NAD-binding protein [Candidatus Diapherotrites archaeon]
MFIIILIIFVIKPLILFFITLLSGFGSKMAVRVGISLGQVSEFGFELAGIGAVTVTAAGTSVLSNELFSFLITIIAVSMIVTPYLTTSSSRVAQLFYDEADHLPKSLRRRFFRRKLNEIEAMPSKKALNDHIVIVGGGTIGRGLGDALSSHHQVVIVDHDPEVVKRGVEDGLPYVYGSADNDSLWEKLDLRHAKLLVLTILNHNEALRMINAARKFYPNITTFAIAHYFSDTLTFYKNGVDFVAMPSVMGSNVFLENISRFLETGKLFYVQNFKTEYMDYLKQKEDEERRYRQSGVKSGH